MKKQSTLISLSFPRRRESTAISFWIPVFTGMTLLLVGFGGIIKAGTYSGGTGEPNDPYLIATAEDMNSIGAEPNDWDAHFLLVADINLAEYTGTQFNIIGNNTTKFTGVFDGNDHSISNFTYTAASSDYIGLFGYVDDLNAEIKILTLVEPNVIATGSSHYAGSLVGYIYRGTIRVCCVKGGGVTGGRYTGGLVGASGYYSAISNCYSTASVTGISYYTGGLVGENVGEFTSCYSISNVSGAIHVGGLAGANYGTISNSYSTGAFSGISDVGGLVGYNDYGRVSGCYSLASVLGDDDVGGLVGENYGSEISDCYSSGNVEGRERVGGLVGRNLVGYSDDATVSNSYSISSVIGEQDYIGGFVGYDDDGLYTKCFWDSDINPDINGIGNTTDPNVIDKSTVEMKTESTFTDAGWDFIDIWNIGENQTYPFLRVYPAGDINHDDIVNFYDLAILAGRWLEGN